MGNTKKRILDAAETLICEKGIAGTTISELAREAGIADSLVYKHFRGKEDLLFSVAYERLQEALAQFDEALQGIRDAESRLRRMVWYSLRYNDLHPGYTRTLLLECRSNPRFYASPAHELLRRHAAITTDILRQGVAEGCFRDDIDMRLVRDIVYGVLDFEAISAIAIREVDATINDFDAVMALLIPMVRKRTSAAAGNEERLLSAAEKVFATRGFAKAKVSDIARLAGTAEGTVYDHFKSKEDLLFSIPMKRFREHLEKLPEVFRVESPARKLRRLLRYHFTLYSPNREFLKVFLLDIQLSMRFYRSEAYPVFRQYLEVIEEVIEEGKALGSFRSDVDPRVFRNMFLGAFTHLALRWLIVRKDKPVDRMVEIDQLMDLLSWAVADEGD
jgi:TetR/AcrR family fatty acid metabolism transcriptional regulator